MANSKYEYVKDFEQPDNLMPETFIVVRVDGRGFTKFCAAHDFEKPNDIRCAKLMNSAAVSVMQSFSEIVIAYGESDEYSFVFKKNASTFNRRREKISTCK